MIAARIFLLSPAYAGGERARMILSERAQFDLAKKLRAKQGAPIGEVFAFLSGLYFRGKIAYANAFAHPFRGGPEYLSLRRRADFSLQQRVLLSMTCVNSLRSTFTRMIRVTARRSSGTHGVLQKSCRRGPRSFFSAALPRESMLMFCWRIFVAGCGFLLISSGEAT